MRRFFDKQLDELIVGRRVAGVFDHAEGKTLIDGVIGKVMLHGETGETFLRQLAGAQFAEVAAIHELLDTRVDDLPH